MTLTYNNDGWNFCVGQHYWYKISRDMDCDDFFPVFLLYNRGRLNGFGWNTIGYINSTRCEHPTPKVLSRFFHKETQPQCLNTAGPLSTQHLYFDWPYNNFC
ncbi:hypothetical protein QZH41_008468 [Actinostola sp. cb2023]|nr:hypothetical protein QZH41_008468 [Actinostola sp. cb2023]